MNSKFYCGDVVRFLDRDQEHSNRYYGMVIKIEKDDENYKYCVNSGGRLFFIDEEDVDAKFINQDMHSYTSRCC